MHAAVVVEYLFASLSSNQVPQSLKPGCKAKDAH